MGKGPAEQPTGLLDLPDFEHHGEGTDGDKLSGPEHELSRSATELERAAMHPIRRLADSITASTDFEAVIMVIIAGNVITLALHDPLATDFEGRNLPLWYIDLVFTALFTVEMLLKMLALGVTSEAPWLTYFSDPWNCFDAVMVAIGYTQLIPAGSAGNTAGVRALRALRALRPLRTISRFESLKFVMDSFISALPLMGSVCVLLLVLLYVYAAVGLQAFNNIYHRACVSDADGTLEGGYDDPDLFGCSRWRDCPSGYTCTELRHSTAMNTGGFDNFGLAFLTVYQCLTLTGWDYVMYRAMDASSPFAAIYFVSLVFLGAYCMMNLFIAVLKTKFAKGQAVRAAQLAAEAKGRHKRKTGSMVVSGLSQLMTRVTSIRSASMDAAYGMFSNRTSRSSRFSSKDINQPTEGAQTTVLQQLEAIHAKSLALSDVIAQDNASMRASKDGLPAHVRSKPRESLTNLSMGAAAVACSATRQILGSDHAGSTQLQLPHDHDHCRAHSHLSSSVTAGVAGHQHWPPLGLVSARPATEAVEPWQDDFVVGDGKVLNMLHPPQAAVKAGNVHFANVSKHADVSVHFAGTDTSSKGEGHASPAPEPASAAQGGATPDLIPDLRTQKSAASRVSWVLADDMAAVNGMQFVDERTSGSEYSLDGEVCWSTHGMTPWQAWWHRTRHRADHTLRHPLATVFSRVATFASVALLAAEHDGMHAALQLRLVKVHFVCIYIFIIEAVLHLVVKGPTKYFKSGWRLYDFSLTVLAVVELIMEFQGGLAAVRDNPGLRAIRAVRVARILNVFEYVSWLAEIAKLLVDSFQSFIAIAVLVLLFWLVFGIIGMNVFGGAVLDQEYPNYDTFMSSILISFQVLTLENYSGTMYSVVRATNYGSTLWFTIWILIGKYTFLSLFLTVCLEAFDKRAESRPPPPDTPEEGSVTFERFSMLRKSFSLASVSMRSFSAAFMAGGSSTGDGRTSVAHRARGHLGSSERSSTCPGYFDSEKGNSEAQVQLPRFLPNQRGRNLSNNSRMQAVEHGDVRSPSPHANMVTPSGIACEWQKTPSGSPIPPEQLLDGVGANSLLQQQQRAATTMEAPSALRHAHSGRAQTRMMRTSLQPIARLERASSTTATEFGLDTAKLPAWPGLSSSLGVANTSSGQIPGEWVPRHTLQQPRAAKQPQSIVRSMPELVMGAHNMDGRCGELPGSLPGCATVSTCAGQIQRIRQQQQQQEDAAGSWEVPESSSARPGSGRLSVKPPSRHSAQHGNHETVPGSNVMERVSGRLRPQPVGESVEEIDGMYAGADAGLSANVDEPVRMPHPTWTAAEEPVPCLQRVFSAGGPIYLPTNSTTPAFDSPVQQFTESDASASNHMASNLVVESMSSLEQPDDLLPPCSSSARLNSDGGDAGPSFLRHTPQRSAAAPLESLDPPAPTTSDSASSHRPSATTPPGCSDSRPDTSGAGRPASRRSSWLVSPRVAPDTALQPSRSTAAAMSSPGHTAMATGGHGLGAHQGFASRILDSAPEFTLPSRPRTPDKAHAHFIDVVQGRPLAKVQRRFQRSWFEERAALHPPSSSSQVELPDLDNEDALADTSQDGTSTAKDAGVNRRRNCKDVPPLAGMSLWCLSPDMPFRQHLYNLVTNTWWETFMFVVVSANCAFLAAENPRTDNMTTDIGKAIYYSDYVFTIIFSIEAVCKIVAFGFVPYIQRITNVIDLTIMVTSVLELALNRMQFFHALRVLRVLKPIRALTHSEGMQQVARTVGTAITFMGPVTVICMLAMLIFGVLGVQLFSGRMAGCNDEGLNLLQCIGSYHPDPVNASTLVLRKWSISPLNFDNLGQALLVLFITLTCNGYTPTMIEAMSAPQHKGGPQILNQNWAAFVYFFVFVLVCALILINLYTGVIFSEFTRLSGEEAGSAWLTSGQQQWVAMQQTVYRLKPLVPTRVPLTSRLRLTIRGWVNHPRFDYIMGGLTLLNCIWLTTTTYQGSHEFRSGQMSLNVAFIAAFLTEATLRLIALGPRAFWQSAWNKLDVVILALAIIQLGIGGRPVTFPTLFKVMHIFAVEKSLRALKLGRVLEQFKTIKALYATFIAVGPAFANIGGLIFLVFFLYAYIGVMVFGHLQRGPALNEHANFESWWKAMLVLLRCATGDNWSNIFIDMIPQDPPRCDESLGACGHWASVPYIVSFMLFVYFIGLQIFMAVIIEGYEHQIAMSEWETSPLFLDELVWAWAEFDDGSSTIDPKDLPGVLMRLQPPMGLGADATADEIQAFLRQLHLPLVNRRMPLLATAFELSRRCAATKLPNTEIAATLARSFNSKFRHLKEMPSWAVDLSESRNSSKGQVEPLNKS